MSANHSHHEHAHHHGHADHHDDHHGGAHIHVTKKEYVTGFVLSVILTAIPFTMVMGKWFEASSTAAFWILGLGAIQIVVHMVCFLHMNRKAEGGWTMLAFMFTLLLVVITLAGSLWVMFHLDANLMPASSHELRIRP
ncbi:MAG: cytochrome o ubiquinol oxidase subunit IV [Lautropia sp.]|nr:cytochrome o ubiquinol oxidase subunit IV [Lautropia sp.]